MLRRFEISSGEVILNLQVKVLSSADREKLKKFEHVEKSLINVRSSNGPKIDP